MESLIYNNNICRLCLSTDGTINIFNKMNSSASCADKVMFCTRIVKIFYIPCDAIKDLENLNDAEIFPNEILEISLHNPEDIERKVHRKTMGDDDSSNTTSDKSTETKGDERSCCEPRIGIVKLGEEAKVNGNLVKNFMCEHCGHKFNKSNQLVVHTRIHTNEKPFECDVCKKSFVLSHHLKAHRRIHASDPDERRPFKCKYCVKTFSENSSLSRHLKVHENVKVFMCTFCKKKFITLADVRKHLVRHSGLKPYQCTLCDKKYSNPSNLSKHKKKHTTNGDGTTTGCVTIL